MEIRRTIVVDHPIGWLEHKPTDTRIGVYKPIGWFKRLMLRWCFGFEYIKYKPYLEE